jgi:glucose/arabinose dehydrogenase
MSIGRCQAPSRRPGSAVHGAGSLLAGLLMACSGDAVDEAAPPAPQPPVESPTAPPASDGVQEVPAAAGGVSEPAPTPPSASEGPGAPPALDPGPAASPPVSPSADAPAAEPPPAEPPPVEPPAVEPPPVDATAPSCVPPEAASVGLRLTEIVTGLEEPIFVTAAPGDATRLYVLERTGAIRVVRDGQLLPEPFLDLRGRVATVNEEGLVGLAFHPNYQENGRFFVDYALLDPARGEDDDEQVVLSELARSASDPDRANAASEKTLMVVEQPADIHLGGMLAFGPLDGMLYVSRGDGGTLGSQDTERLFGKILRIDIDTVPSDLPYGLPEGNMGGDGVLPEIWNMGLRNPWRFSFDACTGDLYIGDVGENSVEEINVEPANTPGRNYGWKTLEGAECVTPDEATEPVTVCDTSGFTPPTVSYSHDEGCSVTGGYVYRGQRIPSLRGTYLYADYCGGSFRSFRFDGGQAVGAADITLDLNPGAVRLITSFGVDNAGELYVVSQLGGLYRIDPD